MQLIHNTQVMSQLLYLCCFIVMTSIDYINLVPIYGSMDIIVTSLSALYDHYLMYRSFLYDLLLLAINI